MLNFSYQGKEGLFGWFHYGILNFLDEYLISEEDDRNMDDLVLISEKSKYSISIKSLKFIWIPFLKEDYYLVCTFSTITYRKVENLQKYMYSKLKLMNQMIIHNSQQCFLF